MPYTVRFDHLNMALLNKSINFIKKNLLTPNFLIVVYISIFIPENAEKINTNA